VEANEMHQAILWSLIDIAISLTMIACMYYWTYLQSGPRLRARRG
jgi:hypothetical protein